MVTLSYPPESRERALGLQVAGVCLGLTLRPVLGGILTENLVGVAAATSSTMRVSGQSFSTGIAALVLAVVVGRHEIRVSDHAHLLTSLRITFLIFSALCVLGVLAALVGPGRRRQVETGQAHAVPPKG